MYINSYTYINVLINKENLDYDQLVLNPVEPNDYSKPKGKELPVFIRSKAVASRLRFNFTESSMEGT